MDFRQYYAPLVVSDTVDGKLKGGYMWEGKLVPFEEADEKFWVKVNSKYPPITLLGGKDGSLESKV